MRLLLSGYYGFGNLGDEALLELIVRETRRRHPGIEIDVLSAQPDETARRYGVTATPRFDLAAIRRSIAAADVVVSGGGGLLQNSTSMRSLLYYAVIIRSAVRAGKKAMIFGQSIGPLDLRGRLVVRLFCGGVSAATVRDERSRALLARLLPKVTVERTADPVFMLDDAAPFDFAAEGLGPESDPIAIVSVRKVPNFEAGAPLVAAAVDRLAERGVRVAFLPLGGAPDADASTIVIRRCRSAPVLLPAYDLDRAAQVIGRAKVLIGMRLHALILAARFGVPFLAIPYDPKVASLCEDLHWPLPPLWDPLARQAEGAAARAAELADRLWDERERLRAALEPEAARMRDLAARNFDALDDLLRA